MNENQSRASAKFQKRAPEQHQLFLSLLAQAAGNKLGEREKWGRKEREANQKWEHQREVERVHRRTTKRVTWSKNLLSVRSISPRQAQHTTTSKIIKIQGLRNIEPPRFRTLPVDILESDTTITRKSTTHLNSTENGEIVKSEVTSKLTCHHHQNLLENRMDCSTEYKNFIFRSPAAEHRKTDPCIGIGDRSSLSLNLPKPWSEI